MLMNPHRLFTVAAWATFCSMRSHASNWSFSTMQTFLRLLVWHTEPPAVVSQVCSGGSQFVLVSYVLDNSFFMCTANLEHEMHHWCRAYLEELTLKLRSAVQMQHEYSLPHCLGSDWSCTFKDNTDLRGSFQMYTSDVCLHLKVRNLKVPRHKLIPCWTGSPLGLWLMVVKTASIYFVTLFVKTNYS